jgi:hypothetical protein
VAETTETKPKAGALAEAERRAAELRALVERANAGDKRAMPALRKLFDATPGLWEANGDLAHHAETAWIRTIAGARDEVFKEALARKLRALRHDLGGPAPSQLERLLVARIVANWLTLQYAEALYAQRMKDGGLSLDVSTHQQERIDRCQRRYLAAIRALAHVRRLQLPAVQGNVADKQVNVGTLSPAPA